MKKEVFYNLYFYFKNFIFLSAVFSLPSNEALACHDLSQDSQPICFIVFSCVQLDC